MANVKIVLNREGVRSLLRSEEMMSICENQANAAVNRLGSGYEVSTYVGRNRVNASITAVTSEAMQENLENNTILKALR
jgi:hypothetical protein